MPNLMLTTRCNFECAYCFGMDFMGSEQPARDMSRETFLGLLAWLRKSPFPGHVVHFMGGEPTLHQDFVWMVETAYHERFTLAIFTNAATQKAPEYADLLQQFDIRWIVNVNPPESRTTEHDQHLRDTLQILGEKVTLTFNMTPEPVPYEWLLDLIFTYNLRKNIKVGFVLPTLSHRNQYLKQEDYPETASRVVEFASLCETFEVSLEYECGIPWCALTPHQLGVLWHCNSKFFSSCNSILDMTPDGRVIYCLPLAHLHGIPFQEFEHYPAAKRWYEQTLNPYRPLGSTSQCFSCQLLRVGECRGGCLSRILHDAHYVQSGGTGEYNTFPGS